MAWTGVEFNWVANKFKLNLFRLIAEEMVKFSFIDPSKYGKGLSEDSLVVLDRLNNRKPVTFKYINRFLDIFPESFPDPKRNER